MIPLLKAKHFPTLQRRTTRLRSRLCNQLAFGTSTSSAFQLQMEHDLGGTAIFFRGTTEVALNLLRLSFQISFHRTAVDGNSIDPRCWSTAPRCRFIKTCNTFFAGVERMSNAVYSIRFIVLCVIRDA